jgi:L-iditol 2-dehydrogenase
MKSWVLYGIGDMRFEETEKPVPKADEVLVKVTNAGICSSDIGRVFGSGAYHYPIILGHEFSGIIEDEGEMNGKRVTVFPLIPCFACDACKAKRYETCKDYSYIGSRQNGAFSEYVAVPKWNILEIPSDVSPLQACLAEPVAVSLHAVKLAIDSDLNPEIESDCSIENKTETVENIINSDLNPESKSDCITENKSGKIEKSKSIAVVGDGAIGKIIAKWFRLYGYENVALLGRNDADISAELFVEAVGSAESLQRCITNVNPNGTIIAVGNPPANFRLEQKTYWQILRKQITLKGSWNSSYPSDWQESLRNINRLGTDDIITHRFGFEDADKAFDLMHRKKEKHGKVVICF